MAGRGWAWTAYDWDEGRLFNYVGDAQNTFPIWNATPLVALDVYEHAYFLDYQTDRGAYIDAFFDNLDWATVDDWVVEVPDSAEVAGIDRRSRFSSSPATCSARCRSGTGSSALTTARTCASTAAATSARSNVWRVYGRRYGVPVDAARRREGLRGGHSPACSSPAISSACSPAARRCPATGGRSSSASGRAGRRSRRPAASSRASRRSSGSPASCSGCGLFLLFRYASVASIGAAAGAAARRLGPRRAVAGDRLRGAGRRRRADPAPRQHQAAARRHREPVPLPPDSAGLSWRRRALGSAAARSQSSRLVWRSGATPAELAAELADRSGALGDHVVRVDRLEVHAAGRARSRRRSSVG